MKDENHFIISQNFFLFLKFFFLLSGFNFTFLKAGTCVMSDSQSPEQPVCKGYTILFSGF